VKDRYRLVVIGAGPAGSYAALTAAKKGIDVLLLERDEEIGRPLACAEAVSDFGFRKFMEPDPDFVSTEIHAIAFTVANGYRYKHQFSYLVGYVLNRPKFDQYLAEHAVDAGVELRTKAYVSGIEVSANRPAKIEMETRAGKLSVHAEYVIAADGVESMIGRMAGINTYLKLAQTETTLQYRVTGIDLDSECLEFCVGKTYAPGGYLWVFPKSDHSANVGLGFNPARYAGGKLHCYLDRFLRKRYGKFRIESTACGIVPKYVGRKILGRENLLLAGDAARTLDSATGAGITKAMHTGRLAAGAIIASLENNLSRPALQKFYRKSIGDEIGQELSFCRKIYPILRKFSDDDWETLIRFLRKLVDKEKSGPIIDPVTIVKSAFTGSPRLIRLARHIL
jgi:digeranylgeranylglycerophospholipid reductase